MNEFIFFKRKPQEEVPFEIGTELWIEINENKCNNVSKGTIIDRKLQIFFEVDFGDGTYSSDMLPEDIEVLF